jgi:hypothetical protein
MTKVLEWLKKDVYHPLLEMNHSQRTAAAAVGVVGGIFPVPALTTFATLLVVRLADLHTAQSAVAVAINIAVAPLQIALIPSFASAGSLITGADGSLFTSEALLRHMGEGLVSFAHNGASLLVHATLAWVLLVCVTLFVLRFL